MEQNIPDISTSIGNTQLQACTINASGCWCTDGAELDQINYSSSGAITTKSSTVAPRKGNDHPRSHFDQNWSINSMGIPNHGYKFYLDYIKNHPNNKPIIISIAPFSVEELTTMLNDIHELTVETGKTQLVEINLSCPNLVSKSIVAYDFDILEQYVGAINYRHLVGKLQNTRVGLKLPPYNQPEQFQKVAEIVEHVPISFISCINSVVNGLYVDYETEKTLIHPKEGLGGVGGQPAKPVALANVNQFYKLLPKTVDIIGCGGISTGLDMFEHILCGAKAVQIGSQLMYEGPSCFERINQELMDIMIKKGYTTLNDFHGKLKVVDKMHP